MPIDPFTQISIGDEAEFKHKITSKDVDVFADLTGDNNPLHMEDDFAIQTTFKNRVVHGMLTASFLSTLIGTRLPGKGALWYEQHLQFLAPVRIGEEIRVWAKVKHKSEAQRVVTLETIIFNEQGKKVISGEAKVKLLQPLKHKGDNNMEDNTKGAVIISGASRGIGASIAKALAQDGYAVVLNYNKSSEQAEQAVEEICLLGGRAFSYKADVRKRAEVEEMVAKALAEYGRIDGIVNNASSAPNQKSFTELTWEDIEYDVEIQIKGAFNLCQSVIPHFIENKKGRIVSLTSIVTDNNPPIKWLSYSMAKSGLVSFTRSLAVEFGPYGITANNVSPGMTETTMIADLPEKAKLVTKMQAPLRRLAQPEDVAGVVSFLFSDKASYITGETLRVCGGQIMI